MNEFELLVEKIKADLKAYEALIRELRGGTEGGAEVSNEYANYVINVTRGKMMALQQVLSFSEKING